MTYKTGTKFGQKTQTVTVHTNDSENKAVQLKITVDIETKLTIDPDKIYFGRLRKGGHCPEKYVVLSGTDKDITKINSVISKNNSIKAEIVPTDTAGLNHGQQIKVSVLPDMKVGMFNERITVNTDHREKRELTFFVSGEVVGNITVLPPNLSFGMFRKGGKYEKNIRLTAAPGMAFQVLEVKSTTPDLTAKVRTLKDGLDYLVMVSLGEAFDKDTLNGKILITTDDKEQENIVIPVFGRALNENPWRVSPGKAPEIK